MPCRRAVFLLVLLQGHSRSRAIISLTERPSSQSTHAQSSRQQSTSHQANVRRPELGLVLHLVLVARLLGKLERQRRVRPDVTQLAGDESLGGAGGSQSSEHSKRTDPVDGQSYKSHTSQLFISFN